ncbi:MAG: carboxypeptidase regulatory-like domain-containing protein, partial [Acidobacteria bacterium]|nr:carboxypeptidase regulatory-like domain-containing protein [Acidobacteriota bacterium]
MPALAARVAALLSAAALLAGISPAQTTSTIAGTVRDQTGGVVAGATVTVRQAQTGLVRTEISDQEGRFVVPALPVGSYELRAEAKAFRPILRKGVQLTVGRIAVVDFHLEVGQVDQEITVTAEASPVNTGSAELSYLVPEQAIRELPLNGRNYIELAFLQPGVVSYPHRDTGSVVAHGVSMSVNGQDPRANLYLLDGTPMNDFTNGPAGSAAGTALGTETIQEFRVETNAYSAEFGRNFGGQVNILTKSGSNALHGSLYHFHRNDNLDARDFFDAAKPEFKRNQAGATLGGPIRTDKAFFFVGYEA